MIESILRDLDDCLDDPCELDVDTISDILDILDDLENIIDSIVCVNDYT